MYIWPWLLTFPINSLCKQLDPSCLTAFAHILLFFPPILPCNYKENKHIIAMLLAAAFTHLLVWSSHKCLSLAISHSSLWRWWRLCCLGAQQCRDPGRQPGKAQEKAVPSKLADKYDLIMHGWGGELASPSHPSPFAHTSSNQCWSFLLQSPCGEHGQHVGSGSIAMSRIAALLPMRLFTHAVPLWVPRAACRGASSS